MYVKRKEVIYMRNLNNYINKWYDMLFEIGIVCPEDKITWTVNKRLRKCFGKCIYENGEFEIQISDMMLDENTPESSLDHVGIHEILHAVCPGEGHSGEWRYLANQVNKHYDLGISTTANIKDLHIPLKYYKHVLRCPECGGLYGFTRLTNSVKNPEDYMCPKCKHEGFEIIKGGK
jgi:predicted SprT family Zn-dependent metalloprotease